MSKSMMISVTAYILLVMLFCYVIYTIKPKDKIEVCTPVIQEKVVYVEKEFKLNAARVTVTTFQANKKQCDEEPSVSCLGLKIVDGDCALSRDLFVTMNVAFGDNIFLEGVGVYRVMDITNKRLTKTIDILTPDKRNNFCKKNVLMVVINEHNEV